MKWLQLHYLLLLALTLGLLLRAAGWHSDDEKRRFVLFEVDEIQHVDIAFVRYQQLSGDTLDHTFTPIFNVRGYGIVGGTVAYAWSKITAKAPTVGSIIRINRQLSTVFALLLIWVVYLLGRGFGLSEKEAGTGALLLAFCDLNCSYSHYGIPAIGYVFGCYLTLLGILQWERKRPSALIVMALGAAIAFSFKFDFLPLLVVGGYLLYKVWTNEIARVQSGESSDSLANNSEEPATISEAKVARLASKLMPLILGFLLFLFCIGLITGFSWSLDSMWDSWQTLRRENQDVIARDQHWLENPVVYGAAVIGGIGVLATSLAIMGLKHLPRKELSPAIVAMLVLIGLEFLLRWSIDTPFVRRANIFMPTVALGAVYGIKCLRLKNWQIGLLVSYTLLLALMGQSNHWFDTRSRARDWMAEHLPADAVVAATPYAAAANSRKLKDYRPGQDYDYLLLHEAYTARYWKSMTTPFGLPDCCEEVYHCRGEEMCSSIQTILANNSIEWRPVAQFHTYRFMPERWLYHQLFGPYESFLGDATIYQNIKPD